MTTPAQREASRRFRKRHLVRIRARGRELYQLNRDHIRARKKASRARNRAAYRQRARERYRKDQINARAQKRAAYHRNVIHNRARALRWRRKNLQVCRERDRRNKWDKRRKEGRPTLAEIRDNATRPEVIEARRLHKKQAHAAYSRKNRKRLTENARRNVLARYDEYLAYHRTYEHHSTPEQRAKWTENERQRRLREIQNLDDCYLKELICNAAPRVIGIRGLIPSELVELKRQQVLLERNIRRKGGKKTCTQAKLAA